MEKKEKREQFKDLVIYTTTFYGTDEVSMVREKLALNFLRNTHNLNIRCVLVDGGSNQGYLDQVKQLENVELLVAPELNMGDSRKKALEIAVGYPDAENFLWAEPEKYDLITKENLNAMLAQLRAGKTEIVVPKRKTMHTLPKLQAWIETRANRRATNIMKGEPEYLKVEDEIDFWFGPKMFNRQGAEYFLNYKGKLNKWDVILKPVINAYRDGKRVCSVLVDYEYDPSQSESERKDKKMKNKRIEQYVTILRELGDSFCSK